MSKEMREQINKVKNWKQFLNESSNYFIIKKKEDDEYVSHNDDNTSRFGGYSITHNKKGAAKFSTKSDAIEIINKYNLELHLMSELEVVNFITYNGIAVGAVRATKLNKC